MSINKYYGLQEKNAHDNSVTIDTKDSEISHILHPANASNGGDCLRFVGIKDIHSVIRTSVQILANLPVDQGGVLPRQADRRINGVCLNVETCSLFKGKIPREHVICHGLQDVL